MNQKRSEEFYEKAEKLTRQWWFYLAVFLVFAIPPFSVKPVPMMDIPSLVSEIMSNPLIFSAPVLFPVFKIIPFLLVLGLIFLENRMKSTFNIYGAFYLLVAALFQTTAFTRDYGFAVMSGNTIIYLLIMSGWLWESITGKSDYSLVRPVWWRYLVMPVAFFAFWYPVGFTASGSPVPDFNPAFIVTNEAGLIFCSMMPFFIGSLTLYYPRVNVPVLRITSFAGLVTGFFALLSFFVIRPDLWWMGIIHLPLFLISAYGFVLSFMKVKEYVIGGKDGELEE